MDIRKKGIENEGVVAKHYREQGYQVIEINEKGFPDLIILKDKQVLFFVEVKARGVPPTHVQKEAHIKWKKEGFETKVKCVADGKVVKC